MANAHGVWRSVAAIRSAGTDGVVRFRHKFDHFDDKETDAMTCNMWIGVSLAAALALAGCEKKQETPQVTQSKGGGEGGHVHGTGPNGGVVFDLGKYHAEFTVDHDKKTCTIHMLGDDEQTPTPVAATELTVHTKETKTEDGKHVPAMTIKLLPTDTKDGKATTFVGSDPGLGNVADFEGTASGIINGKPASKEFKE